MPQSPLPEVPGVGAAKWLEERAAELLPVPYFHVVFTLPEMIGPLALQNPRAVYGILFQAAAETLLEVAATPRRLGAKIGFLAVLHTWGQNLMHHPHLHCVVPGGGLSPDGSRWIPCREGFFLPVRILSRVFRGKFLSLLRKAYQRGKLRFYGELKPLEEPEHFERWLDATVKTEWVVYAKPPFGGPEQVLKYLARYTHRVAISNDRLIALEDGRVRFHWKDYAHGNAQKTMTLDAAEFIRRFLLHVLPTGFMKIRHYGFLANRNRREMVSLGANCSTCVRLLRRTIQRSQLSPRFCPPTASPTNAARPANKAGWCWSKGYCQNAAKVSQFLCTRSSSSRGTHPKNDRSPDSSGLRCADSQSRVLGGVRSNHRGNLASNAKLALLPRSLLANSPPRPSPRRLETPRFARRRATSEPAAHQIPIATSSVRFRSTNCIRSARHVPRQCDHQPRALPIQFSSL